jgi:hypothetical protein
MIEELQKIIRIRSGIDPSLEPFGGQITEKAKRTLVEMTIDLTERDFVSRWKHEDSEKRANRAENEKKHVEEKVTDLENQLRSKDAQIIQERQSAEKKIKSEKVKAGEVDKATRSETRRLRYEISGLRKNNNDLMAEMANLRIVEKITLDASLSLGDMEKRFLQKMEMVIESRAQTRLEKLETEVWPAWHKQYYSEQVQLEAENQINEYTAEKVWDRIDFLLTPKPGAQYQIACDQCGSVYYYDLRPMDSQDLIQNGYITIECPNPGCVDKGILNTKHLFTSTIIDVLLGLKTETQIGTVLY